MYKYYTQADTIVYLLLLKVKIYNENIDIKV